MLGTTSLFKRLLDRKPFQKRLERKPQTMFEFEILSPNPIGVINRRNGFDKTAQRLHLNLRTLSQALLAWSTIAPVEKVT